MNILETKYKTGELNEKQQYKFTKLVQGYEIIFAKDSKDLGKTNLAKHTIDTGDHKPFKEIAYRVNPFKKEVIEKRDTRYVRKRSNKKIK